MIISIIHGTFSTLQCVLYSVVYLLMVLMLLSPLLSPVIWYGTRIFLIDLMVLFLCLYCRAHTSH